MRLFPRPAPHPLGDWRSALASLQTPARGVGGGALACTTPSISPAAQPNLRASSSPSHPRLNLRLAVIGHRPSPPAARLCLPPLSRPPHSLLGGILHPRALILPRSPWAFPNSWLHSSHLRAPSTKKAPSSPRPLNPGGTLLPQGLCSCCPVCLEPSSPNPVIAPSSFPQPPFSVRPFLPAPLSVDLPPVAPGPSHCCNHLTAGPCLCSSLPNTRVSRTGLQSSRGVQGPVLPAGGRGGQGSQPWASCATGTPLGVGPPWGPRLRPRPAPVAQHTAGQM